LVARVSGFGGRHGESSCGPGFEPFGRALDAASGTGELAFELSHAPRQIERLKTVTGPSRAGDAVSSCVSRVVVPGAKGDC
jgi:hypothetical protein